LKCTSTGRECEGYAPLRALVFKVLKGWRERRSISYFHERIAHELCGDSRSRLRDGFVLRVSHIQEGVRHGIAAISTLHESLELETGQKLFATQGIAFEQHSEAITILTNRNLAHFSKHCDIILGIPERGNQMGGSLKHTVDFGGFYYEHSVVPSLFLTASRRSGPHVRRCAILVLRRYRWREDIWDSEIAASLAEHLMLLEVTGLRNIIEQECARIERPLLGSTHFLCLQLGGQVASSSRVVIPQSAPLQQHLYDIHS
jgi:hypothetical protein